MYEVRVFDRRTVHTIGTLSIASGVALLVLSIPAILLGTTAVVSRTKTAGEALDTVLQSVPPNAFVLGASETTLTLGLLGLGASCWLMGFGLLLQGRTEG
ncbi:hypothetical protein ACFFQF_02685 [Haladaptatus pallidirubidus]|uniref:ABC transporter permease n=1 Tax=Haladaptatus pallidirubidus TaxID=1008152 RepID=A0AAV3UAH4_9EURY|nr:hypothetical protein [Haladaptatus pallidirubidus]